ncbi:unnamed protein product [Effrenium voratum]|nr:unnamed protein product [Effrenium voratum]
MSDVGRTSLQRKASHDGSGHGTPDERNYEYYGEESWWEDGYHHFGTYDTPYYEWQEGSDDIFEVDLYSMVFVLDENLAPKDLYTGFEFDEKSLLFAVEADDVAPTTPAAWRSRPLKIHPEPPPFRREGARSEASTPARSGAATDINTGGSNTPTGGRRQKAATPPKIETPSALPPSQVQVTPRPEPPNEDSEPSGDELDSGRTNAKIHISNRQLEHLKQKMQER